jgi:hypothetical protein
MLCSSDDGGGRGEADLFHAKTQSRKEGRTFTSAPQAPFDRLTGASRQKKSLFFASLRLCVKQI